MVPVISISDFDPQKGHEQETVRQLHSACTNHGFFYIKDYDLDSHLEEELSYLSKTFFELPTEAKLQIRMELAGKAWRGYFPVKGELTSGKPDVKEGLYFGIEHDDNSGMIMHGKNQYPSQVPGLKECVDNYMKAVEFIGHRLMEIIAMSLGLSHDFFSNYLTNDPWILFRIFHYPANKEEELWGVGEHTDYGLLTILKQDDIGGLEIKTANNWIEAPYIEGTLICNIGDMLSKMTKGYYKATPHRVKNTSGRSRYSFPLFFDPNWNSAIKPLNLEHLGVSDFTVHERWDKMDLSLFEGTYGDFISMKVGKVFPNL
ncbi:MAG: hypothetical protein MRY83_00205 [Flavobacteriales bacterium]|nr:hypothetical protein [Flavobacteriales bacterium]